MFMSDVVEATQEEVHMKDVDPEAMFALIRYMYVGKYDGILMTIKRKVIQLIKIYLL